METQPGEVATKQGESGEAQADLKTTSGDKELTPQFTPEQIRNLMSDLKAAKGREAKAYEDIRKFREEQVQAKATADAQAEKAELDAVLKDPDATEGEKKRAIKAKEYLDKKLKAIEDKSKAEAELDKRLAEKSDKLSKVDLLERDEKLETLASEKHVDLATLKKAADKITDPIVLSEIADLLPKVVKETPKVDSGKSVGGSKGKKPSLEELKAATPDEYRAKVKSGEWVGV